MRRSVSPENTITSTIHALMFIFVLSAMIAFMFWITEIAPELAFLFGAVAFYIGKFCCGQLFDLAAVRDNEFAPWLEDYKTSLGAVLTAIVVAFGIHTAVKAWPTAFPRLVEVRANALIWTLPTDASQLASWGLVAVFVVVIVTYLVRACRAYFSAEWRRIGKYLEKREADHFCTIIPPSWDVTRNQLIKGIGDIDLQVTPNFATFVVEIKSSRRLTERTLADACTQVSRQAAYLGAKHKIVWFVATWAAKNRPRLRRVSGENGNEALLVEGGAPFLRTVIAGIEARNVSKDVSHRPSRAASSKLR